MRRGTKSNSLLVGLLTAGLVLSAPALANAATTPQAGVTLTPATATLSLAPGQSQQQASFTLTNHYATAVAFHLTFAQSVATPGVEHSALRRLEVTPADVTIAPGESAAPTITLTDSKQLAPGSQQIDLTITQVGLPGQQVSVVPSIRMPLAIIKQAGAVTRLGLASLSHPRLALQLPKKFTFSLGNTGNMTVIPRGYLVILDPHGHETGKSVINTASVAVVPGSQYQASTSTTLLNHPWLPGIYRAQLWYGPGGGQAAQVTSAQFFYLPGWEIAIVVLLAAIAICGWRLWLEWAARAAPPPQRPTAHKKPVLVGRDIL